MSRNKAQVFPNEIPSISNEYSAKFQRYHAIETKNVPTIWFLANDTRMNLSRLCYRVFYYANGNFS